jgi:sugar lactone lactonase YvrE
MEWQNGSLGRCAVASGEHSLTRRRWTRLAWVVLGTAIAVSQVADVRAQGSFTLSPTSSTTRAFGASLLSMSMPYAPAEPVAATQAASCGAVDGPGTTAKFSLPAGLAVDSNGNVFVSDTGNSIIRKITPTGVVTTFAGSIGTSGTADGTGSAARFFVPRGLAFDAVGNLYVADTGNHTIRVITPAGVVSTVAGLGGVSGSADGTGSAARFDQPSSVAVDASGNVYVADHRNARIRKITPGGIVTKLAPDYCCELRFPVGVAVNAAGTVYVANTNRHAISMINSSGVPTGLTDLQEGVFEPAGSHRDGPAAIARLNAPHALTFDRAGNLYVADTGNHVIRVALLSPTTPTIDTHPSSTSVNAGANATFTVTASGNLTPSMQWQVSTNGGTSWSDLSNASPYSGVTTTTLTIIGVTSTLHNARYRAVATNQSGTATSTAALLSVRSVAVNRTSLLFRALTYSFNGSPFAITPPHDVTVVFTGTPSQWTVTVNQGWVAISNPSGSGDGRFTVSIPTYLQLGAQTLTATITVTPSDSSLAPVTIPVTYSGSTYVEGTTQPPIGQMDTPAQNATGVQGAIAVTGWVLDDIGIVSVKVYRNCLPTEPQVNCQTGIVDGASVVYVGDGSVVAGARPDVEAGFPTYPTGNTAGWGIQVLTNMLPRTQGTYAANGGVGPVALYAVATDREGNRTLLSRAYTDTVRVPTSITMDNDAIAKPFGTIDTPAEGSTVSGSIANFGWAITPDSNTTAETGDILIPTNGSTMFVFIDGVPVAPVAPVAYNQCRGNVGNPVPAGVYCNDDIANIFGAATPQAALTTRTANATRYRNLDAQRAAIGAYVINTTGMTSGLHTLAWSVTDSANRTEGIGSRYFNVLNSADTFAGDQTVVAGRAALSRGSVSALDTVPLDGTAILGRSGFDLTSPFVPVEANDDGVRRVNIDTTGRLELQLGAVTHGYLASNGTLRDLPVGSHLDTDTGTFTWAPGPGYLGTYRLTFLGASGQVVVDVTIKTPDVTPEGQSEIRMHLDEVRSAGFGVRSALDASITVEGWALDPRAFSGSGIGAVHVWARRLDVPTTGPVFVGEAVLGGSRPDVADAFGGGFLRAGYHLRATLVPGRYAVTAYAWNHRTNRWEDARTVEVRVR